MFLIYFSESKNRRKGQCCMHEWALADAVLACAKKTAEDNSVKKIDEVVVSLGELQNIHIPSFTEVFDMRKKDYGDNLISAKLVIENEKAKLICQSCGNNFYLSDSSSLTHEESEAIHFIPETARIYINCPKCKSPDFKIVEGRGVSVKEIRGEK